MLVLAAVYSNNLSQLVDGEKLEKLLHRTIKKLNESAALSPTLKTDAQILEHIRRELFESGGSGSSFASFHDS